MIRRSARNDPSAGCVIFEKPLSKAIDEYKEIDKQASLKDAYDKGYQDGYNHAMGKYATSLDPYGEAGR